MTDAKLNALINALIKAELEVLDAIDADDWDDAKKERDATRAALLAHIESLASPPPSAIPADKHGIRHCWSCGTPQPLSQFDPATHCIVPREPTPAMVEAICAEHTSAAWPDAFDAIAQRIRRQYAREGHRAMIDASVKP